MEDLNDIFKEPDLLEEDDTMTLLTKIELLNDEIIAWEERWKKLKEKIEIERGCIRASEDDGYIRVGQFRTLNKICEIVNELEGMNEQRNDIHNDNNSDS